MKRLLVFILCNFYVAQSAQACDYPSPDFTTSEYISEKTVFWGVATAKKWKRNTENEEFFLSEDNIFGS